jgi:hypothetical protein
MPIAASYSRSGSDHFHDQQKTHPGLRDGIQTRLYDCFISPDFENKPCLGLFLNRALFGLLFDLKMSYRRLNWALIGVSLCHTYTQDMAETASLSPVDHLKTLANIFRLLRKMSGSAAEHKKNISWTIDISHYRSR